jgi:hypothetical protein
MQGMTFGRADVQDVILTIQPKFSEIFPSLSRKNLPSGVALEHATVRVRMEVVQNSQGTVPTLTRTTTVTLGDLAYA